jgi:hypothetical protein
MTVGVYGDGIQGMTPAAFDALGNESHGAELNRILPAKAAQEPVGHGLGAVLRVRAMGLMSSRVTAPRPPHSR